MFHIGDQSDDYLEQNGLQIPAEILTKIPAELVSTKVVPADVSTKIPAELVSTKVVPAEVSTKIPAD